MFHFDGSKPIAIKDLWSSLIPISKEVYSIFSGIINSDEIKKIMYYDDPRVTDITELFLYYAYSSLLLVFFRIILLITLIILFLRLNILY
jgi:hypothetical protein